MGIFNWISDMFSSTEDSSLITQSDQWDTIESSRLSTLDDTAINPLNGLPMISGIGSVDILGNPFGTDFSHDYMSSSWNSDLSSSSFDDSLSSNSFSGISDW